ncbi:MAG TPA: YeeE/YedE family protein [Nannocystis exedens]|nr:YeeE/YedE family protein [Nannocystis exedens]
MSTRAIAFITGLIFALGLGISGMTQPLKVRDFLDVSGNWDPSLAFVMAGGVLVYVLVFRLVLPRLDRPIAGDRFGLPTRRDLDAPLIVGSAIFGIGWGLGGFCPGPALTSLLTGMTPVLVFIGAMALGMALHSAYKGLRG